MSGREIFANINESPVFLVVEDTVHVLAAASDNGGAYEIFEVQCPRETGPPLHAHPWNEAYVIMDGELEITIGEQRMRATPGCFVNVPGGTLHTYRALTDATRFILITNPAGAGDFFVEIDRQTRQSKDDIEKIVGIALRHGFTLPPPPAA